jgi:hypothetical protein
MPSVVEALDECLHDRALPADQRRVAQERRRALVTELHCEFSLSALARLGTVTQMEALGMLVGPKTPPYPPLAWDDLDTDRHAYLRAHDRPAEGGIARWKYATTSGGLVYPSEIAAALARLGPKDHERAAQRVVWWPGYVAFLEAAQAHGGFFT